ncbi:MAG TPA: class I SAM-dependent methyltransferase [archaeon]|nr:class I SAM-dependent methyltransferase [archaeon]
MNGFDSRKESSHSIVVALAGKNKKILEFGCGKGFVSEQLKKNACRVTAVEINPESAKLAEKFCEKIFLGNIETMDFSKVGEGFDIAIFGDVLEHLKNPPEILEKTKKLLDENGRIIVSVPNIANWKIRLKLLFGKFDYASEGILDRTHLKFFTLETIKKTVQEAGFGIEKVFFVPSAPVPTMAMKKLFSRVLPAAFSFQFVILAGVLK